MLHNYTLMDKKSIFGPKFRHFCFFTKFCIYTNSKVLISHMTNVFSNYSQKYQRNAFLVPNLSIFIISQYFAIRQIQGY